MRSAISLRASVGLLLTAVFTLPSCLTAQVPATGVGVVPEMSSRQEVREGSKTIFYRNSFSQHPLGTYTDRMKDRDWGEGFNNGVSQGRVHIVEDAESGKCLRVTYPKGKFGPQESGAQWKLWLNAQHGWGARSQMHLKYKLKFAAGFDFVRGGKLPGLVGGKVSTTGGVRANGYNGWSGRVMWYQKARVAQYVYHVDQASQIGDYFWWKNGAESVQLIPEKWYEVRMFYRMNDPEKSDGIIKVWLRDTLVLNKTGLRFRKTKDFAVDFFYFSTFHGGSDSSWAPAATSYAYFDDFEIYDLQNM